jgi:hypothetical protein
VFVLKDGLTETGAANMRIGGAEAAGFFKEATDFDSEDLVASKVTHSAAPKADSGNTRPASVGSSISGEVTDQRHTSWLEVLSQQKPVSVKE